MCYGRTVFFEASTIFLENDKNKVALIINNIEWNREEFNKHLSPHAPSTCAWKLGLDPLNSPRTLRPVQTRAALPDSLHFIGNTPLVKLNEIPQSESLECDMYAKCEFFNPGGSSKDRIAQRMVLDAEYKGLLKPGYTIIEPTSGNTGIGLALVSTLRGNRRKKMSSMNNIEWCKREFKHVSPYAPSMCAWKLGLHPKESPHTRRPVQTRAALPDSLHFIGNTPLVKLNKIPQSEGLECDMYAKCEFFNPGGSEKDRIAYRMVLDAEDKGLLKPGYTIIEPTSGNTGIGLALVSAHRGYRCIIVMPEKNSNEKVDTLIALGAEVIKTRTSGYDDPESHFAVSQCLNKEIPNSIILDQFRNPGNPLAHYDGTGSEILDALNNKVDMVVMGAGTGGTVTGIGRIIKERCPSCKIVAGDPVNSVLAPSETTDDIKLSTRVDDSIFETEGVGSDFVPGVLDRSVIDEWYKSNDMEGLPMARRLIKEEGLLCGGSSGFALAVAIKAAKKLKKGDKCVVVLPDGMRNYMTKFVSDNWMEARGLQEIPDYSDKYWWWNEKISTMSLSPPHTLHLSVTCGEAIKLFKLHNVDQLPVVDTEGHINGMVIKSQLINKLISENLSSSNSVDKVLHNQYRNVDQNKSLGLASRILEKEHFVLVTNVVDGKVQVSGMITSLDLLNHISSNSP